MISAWVIPGVVDPKSYKKEEKTEPIKIIYFDPKVFTQAVIDAVQLYYSVSIYNRCRQLPYANARSMASYFLKKSKFYFTYAEIGRLIGYYDHATVLHNVRKIETQLSIKDKQTIYDLKELDLMINYKIN